MSGEVSVVRAALRLLVMLVGVFAVCIVVIRTGYGINHPVQEDDVYLHPGCEVPCWLGLEPGKSTEADIVAVMEENGYTLSYYASTIWDGGIEMNFMKDGTLVQATVADTLLEVIITRSGCPIHMMSRLGKPIIAQKNYSALITSGSTTGINEYFEIMYMGNGYQVWISNLRGYENIRLVLRVADYARESGMEQQSTADWHEIVNDMRHNC